MRSEVSERKVPILGSDNVKETLDKYPFLKDVLVKLSPNFKRLLNPILYNTVARKVTFAQASKVAGVSLCEILHALNSALGLEEELLKYSPGCLESSDELSLSEEEERALGSVQVSEPEEDLLSLLGLSAPEREEERGKLQVTIQSATPVTYPLLVDLLRKEEFREKFSVSEIKVWKETEKHLAWIVQGKADLSFTSVLVMPRLYTRDVYMPAVLVWGNFHLISRKRISGFKDILGEEIYLPLFKEAPPAKITRYVITREGLSPDEFQFKFGNPFGRPEKIYRDLVDGKIENAVLREPEASYAVYELEKRGITYTDLPFHELIPDFNYPNAGIAFKGEFLREYPEEANFILELLRKGIDDLRDRSGDPKFIELLSKVMGVPEDLASLFLKRVNFRFLSGDELRDHLRKFFRMIYEIEENSERALRELDKLIAKFDFPSKNPA